MPDQVTARPGLSLTIEQPVLLEKEDNMWIVYVVVGLVGLVFGILSLVSLELEA